MVDDYVCSARKAAEDLEERAQKPEKRKELLKGA